jgi:hypothetical protein
LQDHLTALNADVADLEASVLAVEDSGFRWGISEDEVTSRRYFLNGVRSEVQVRVPQRSLKTLPLKLITAV